MTPSVLEVTWYDIIQARGSLVVQVHRLILSHMWKSPETEPRSTVNSLWTSPSLLVLPCLGTDSKGDYGKKDLHNNTGCWFGSGSGCNKRTNSYINQYGGFLGTDRVTWYSPLPHPKHSHFIGGDF